MNPYDSEPFLSEDYDQLVGDLSWKYGYDFSQYSKPSLQRRIRRIYLNQKFKSFSSYRDRLLVDEVFFEHFLQEVTVTVTEMFRDPGFFKALAEDVLPALKTLPFIRIWHAGCSTGEEVYSLAILLEEYGLLKKCRLYATDINPKVLATARQATFSIDLVRQYGENYIEAGGQGIFSDYYIIKDKNVVLSPHLKKQIVFASHNLVSDQSFNEFHLIVCRNVLIYFNKSLQDRVLHLFSQSLAKDGFLALGSKESVRFSSSAKDFAIVNKEQKIWKKTYLGNQFF